MAAPLKEYRCAAHGAFESRSPRCPHGCSKRFVYQEIRTAPAYKSERTRVGDNTLRGLATDYRLPDIPTTESGTSVMMELRKNPQHRPTWGNVDHAAPGFSQRGDAKTFNPSSMGVQADNVLQQVQPTLGQPKPLYVARDKPT